MTNPAKPCDVAEYRDRLPCCNPAGTECWGEVAWDRTRARDSEARLAMLNNGNRGFRG